MTISLRFLTIAAAASPVLGQSPFNDAWERALPIGGGYFHSGTTLNATTDGSSTCDVGASLDVWYVYTPQSPGTANAETWNAIDTVMSLHTLDSGGQLIQLACDDDGGLPFSQSRLTWTAGAEIPYYMRVTGKNGITGLFNLTVFASPFGIRPANGSRDTPLSIWPGDYHGYARHFSGSTSACQTFGESAWFTYTPKTSGTATARTDLFAFFDTAIDIEENGVLLFCADSSGQGDVLTFPVQADAQYLIRVGTADGSSGIYGLRLEGPEGHGRICTDPEPISEGSHLVSLVGASSTGSSTCSTGEPDRYFLYVASADGTLNVSTCGTSTPTVQGYAVDARLSLHTGCPADITTELDCSRSSLACSGDIRPQSFVSTPVIQGQQVLIRLSARPEGQLAPILMEIELVQFLSMCFGDGSGAACPCGNTGALHRGCDNSFGAGGARLYATGTASLSADTLSIGVTGAPRTAPILLMHGDAMQNGGAGVPFADGLLCVGGSTAGLAGAISAGGASVFGALQGQPLSTARGMPLPGSTRWYQGYYRNVRPFCTPAGANLTNAVQVTWVP